ncbi:MAG: glycosyltransferase [Patescibacteria group bacterium]
MNNQKMSAKGGSLPAGFGRRGAFGGKKNPLYKIIAIWHGIYRKGSVHEPNIFSDGVFLSKHFPNRIIISNSLYAGGKTTVSFYIDNKLIKKKEFPWIKRLPDIFRYIIESILNLFYLCRYGKYATVLSVDPLSSLMPCVLKKMGYIKKVLFLSPDYARKRFDNQFLNKIYFLIDAFCIRVADVNICNAQTVIDYKNHKYSSIKNKQFHMPNIPSPWIIEKYRNIPKVKGKVIYVGDLGEGVNVDGFKELFAVIKSLEKEIPDIKLFIAGDGDYKNELNKLADAEGPEYSRGNGNNIIFLGRLDHESAIKQIAESEIGIAMYNGDNNYDEFRDSMKVREYQSFGVIPITTNVVRSNAEEILKYNSGILIKEFKFDYLKRSILSIMKDEQFKNNLRLNSVFNSEIYKNKYADLLKLI